MSRLDPRCADCFSRSYGRLKNRFTLTENQIQEFSAFFSEIMKREPCPGSPEVQRELYHYLCRLQGIQDPFTLEKMQSNMVAMELYERWKPRVLNSADPFSMALRLAVAGNIMDYGALSEFDTEKTITEVMQNDFFRDESDALRKEIASAEKILYLGDNAGEIVFDKLLIEMMMHPNVTFAVRGGPVINDVTLEDAKETEMHVVADIISTGYDAPSVILSKSGKGFLHHFETADLIISKGQGNLEGLIDKKDPRIFFLLMVKCDVIAERVHAPVGSALVYRAQ